jgi:hypothetical protein
MICGEGIIRYRKTSARRLGNSRKRLRTQGGYDSRMGRRFAAACRDIGLTAISDSGWDDAELAFNGPAPAEILAAWRRRFARLPVMKAYFGAERFDQIAGAFLESISRPDHRSTARW